MSIIWNHVNVDKAKHWCTLSSFSSQLWIILSSSMFVRKKKTRARARESKKRKREISVSLYNEQDYWRDIAQKWKEKKEEDETSPCFLFSSLIFSSLVSLLLF